MRSKEKLIKVFTVLVLAFAALNLSFAAMDNAVTHSELKPDIFQCFPHHPPATPSEIFKSSLTFQTSNPMDRIFQIIFILFFISPPLIVILLFLIWCELKKRNEK